MEEESRQTMKTAQQKAVSFSVPVGWCVLLTLLFVLMIVRVVATPSPMNRPPEPAAGPKFRVNINEASAQELRALPDIGPAMAQRIIQYREQHGSFHSIDDLTLVHGFGPKTLAALRPMLQVAPSGRLPRVAAR